MSRAFKKWPALLLLATLGWPASAAPRHKFLVILDPGHGGDDAGAIRPHPSKKTAQEIAEKEITLSLALTTASALKARGIPVVLTRTKDIFVPLDQRTAIVNRAAASAQAAVFVSIHVNSSEESRSSGIETYVFNAASNEASERLADLENGPSRRNLSQSHGTVDLILSDLATTGNFTDSANLACAIQKTVINGLQSHHQLSRDRGIRQALFYVLMQSQVPSVLFEPGFVSNPRELAKLVTPQYQKVISYNLAQGILNWRGRTHREIGDQASNSAKISALAKTSDTPRCQIH